MGEDRASQKERKAVSPVCVMSVEMCLTELEKKENSKVSK